MTCYEAPTTIYVYRTAKTGNLLQETGRFGLQENEADLALTGLIYYQERGAVFVILLEGVELHPQTFKNLNCNPVPVVVIKASSIILLP
jgi:hypothetical protein